MARLNLDVLGGAIKDKPLHGLDLTGDDHGAGFNAMQDDLAGFVRVVEAVVRADSGPGAVHYSESHAGKRLVLGALHKFADDKRGRGGIVEIDGLRVVRVDYQGLRPGVGVDAVAGDRLQLRHDDRTGDAGEDDLAVAVRVVDTVGGHLPVLVVHHLPIGVLDLEFHALQGRIVQGTQLIDNQVPEGLVKHFQGIRLMVLDLHGMGSIIQQVAGLCLDLPHDIAARLQVRQGDKAPLVRPVLAVGIAYHGAVCPGDLENDIRQGFLRGGIHLLHQQSAQGHIGKGQNLRVRLTHNHRLRRGVQQVAVNGFHLGHDIGVGVQLAEVNLAVLVGGVEAVGAGQAFIVGHQLTVRRRDLELDAGKSLSGHAVGFADQEAPLRGIGDNDGLRVAVGPDDNIGAGAIHDIARRGLGFGQHIRAGSQIRNADFAVAVGLEDAALCQRGCADYAVQPHFTASGGSHSKLCVREGLAGDAVPLLDNQLAGGLILEGQGNGAPFLDLDCLRLRVDQEPSGGLRLGDNHALAGLQAGNTDFAILVGAVDAVAVPDDSAIGVGNFELGILEGDAGIDAANLPD